MTVQATSAVSGQPAEPSFRGNNRTVPLPCCSLTLETLRTLYTQLQAKNDELVPGIMAGFNPGETTSRQIAERNVRGNLHVTVIASGTRGERFISHEVTGLLPENMPLVVADIIIDSAWMQREILGGAAPANQFYLRVDLRRGELLDLSNISGEPTENHSHYAISAANQSWAAGVAEVIDSALSATRAGRGWLHHRLSYDAILFSLGIPLALWTTWRLYHAFLTNSALAKSGIDIIIVVYAFLVLLTLVRLLCGVGRWLWPYMDLADRKSIPEMVRSTFCTLVVGLIAGAIYDVVRYLL